MKYKCNKKCFIDFIDKILIYIFYVLTRLPYLGYDLFNTDVLRWKSRIYGFTNGLFSLDFGGTYQIYHPGVTLMWIGGFGVKIYNLFYDVFNKISPLNNSVSTVFELHSVQKILIVLVLGVVIVSIYSALKDLFGMKFAILSITLLSLEPFYLALTRVVHLEGLMSTFMIASAVWLFYYMHKKWDMKYVYLSAFYAGLAFLTKTSSFYMILFTLLTVSLYYVFGVDVDSDTFKNSKSTISHLKDSSLSIFKVFGRWFGVFVLTLFALWPALWVNTLEVFLELYKGVSSVGVENYHWQLYFGSWVEDPGMGFYFVVLAFRTSLYILPGLIGLLVFKYLRSRGISLNILKSKVTGKKVKDANDVNDSDVGNMEFDVLIAKFIEFLGIFSVFYLIQLIIPTKKLDRYILPTLMSLSLISSVFYYYVLRSIKILNTFKKFLIGILILSIPAMFYTVYLLPDYLFYYNPLLGGPRVGMSIMEPKWVFGGRTLGEYFGNMRQRDNFMFVDDSYSDEEVFWTKTYKDVLSVSFPEKYYTQIQYFLKKEGVVPVVNSLDYYATRSKYFVFPVWDDTSSLETDFKLEYFDTIKLKGIDVFVVYKNITMGKW